jgi:hypothetical protein
MLRRVVLVRTNVLEEYFWVFLGSVRLLLAMANVFPSSLILVTLMMKALRSSEMSVLTRSTRRNIQENAILSKFAYIFLIFARAQMLKTKYFLYSSIEFIILALDLQG